MLATGETIDRYVIEEYLGEGGMGVVYRARHRTLGGSYALKLLRLPNQDTTAMALAEGRLQSRIRHPNVALVTDIVNTPAGPALIMEYVDGPNLRDWLRLEAPPLAQRLEVFDGVVQGVAAAHAHGLVHRDIKPGNILLASGRETPFPKVTDFGLARVASAGLEPGQNMSMVGTPGYMAPEQVRAPDAVDMRADIFSLGCVLYELACGRKPFEGDSVVSRVRAAQARDYTPPEVVDPYLSKGVIAAIHGCLEPDPTRRIPSCSVLREVMRTGHAWSPAQHLDLSESTLWDESFSKESFNEVIDQEQRRAEREAELRRILGAQVRARPQIDDLDAWREGLVPEAWRKPLPEEAPPEDDGRRKVAFGLLIGGVFLATLAALLWTSDPPESAAPPEEPVAGPAGDPLPIEAPEPSEDALPAPPKPKPTHATVRLHVTGGRNAKVCLQGDKCYGEGRVPAGTYPIWVLDKTAGSYEAGSVTLAAGETVTVTCDLEAQTCGR